MQKNAKQMRGVRLIDGAGHRLEQEPPEQVSKLLVQFLQDAGEPTESFDACGLPAEVKKLRY